MTLANPFYQKFKSLPSPLEGDATSLWFSFALLFFRMKLNAFSSHIVWLSLLSISLLGHQWMFLICKSSFHLEEISLFVWSISCKIFQLVFLCEEIFMYPNVYFMASGVYIFPRALRKIPKGPSIYTYLRSIRGTREIDRWLQHRMQWVGKPSRHVT